MLSTNTETSHTLALYPVQLYHLALIPPYHW